MSSFTKLPPVPLGDNFISGVDSMIADTWSRWFDRAIDFWNHNIPSVEAVGNTNKTLYPGNNATTQICSVAITTNRTWTLSTTNVKNGTCFHCVRAVSSTGEFTIDVGGLDALAPGEWCEVIYNGSEWVLISAGIL